MCIHRNECMRMYTSAYVCTNMKKADYTYFMICICCVDVCFGAYSFALDWPVHVSWLSAKSNHVRITCTFTTPTSISLSTRHLDQGITSSAQRPSILSEHEYSRGFMSANQSVVWMVRGTMVSPARQASSPDARIISEFISKFPAMRFQRKEMFPSMTRHPR